MRRQGKVGMNLVGDDQKAVTGADVGDATEVVGRPHRASWIVRIGKDEKFAFFCTLLETFEIYCEATLFNCQWTFYKSASGRGGDVKERRIDGGCDQNAVARSGERLYDKRYARYDARDEM